MDIIKNKRIFKNYIKRHYDLQDYNIKRKYVHSLRVAKIMLKLSKQLFPNNLHNQRLCYTIGLLHDFARFKQWVLYKTYRDKNSVDHGDFCVQLLFDDNLISMFDIQKEDYSIIYKAIKYHNKYIIPPEVENDLICTLLVEADRISNIILQSKGKTPLFSDKDGFTDEIVQSFINKEKMDYRYLNTKGDNLLAYMNSTNLLKLRQAKDFVDRKNYKSKILKAYRHQLIEQDYLFILSLLQKSSN